MENISFGLTSILLAVTLSYYTIYLSYYFSIINGLDDLKSIRNKKIRQILSELITDSVESKIDFFYIIDYLNNNNKVWLLDTKKGNKFLKYSLLVFGLISFITIFYFLMRSNIISDNIKNTFNIPDIILIILYASSLTWTIFHFYWDYIYNIAFHKESKRLKEFKDNKKYNIGIISNNNF
jgi:hypothetical protein